MRRSDFRAIAALALAADLAACQAAPTPPEPPSPPNVPAQSELKGTVHFIDVEGGCWAIDTPEGRFEPLKLPEAFRRDGLTVWVALTPATDMSSTCQVGRLARVVTIRARPAE